MRPARVMARSPRGRQRAPVTVRGLQRLLQGNKLRQKQSTLFRQIENAGALLRSRCGWEFFFVAAKRKDPAPGPSQPSHKLWIRSSPALKDLQVNQGFEWRISQIIRSSEQQARQAEIIGLTFEQLPDDLLCIVVRAVLDAAIKSRRNRYPFGETAGGSAEVTAKVVAENTWVPAAIPWRHPKHWARAELLQLLTGFTAGHDAAALRKLLLALPQAMQLNAWQQRQVDVAFDRQLEQQLQQAAEDSDGAHPAAAPAVTGAGTAVALELDTGWKPMQSCLNLFGMLIQIVARRQHQQCHCTTLQ